MPSLREEFERILSALREIGWRSWDPINLMGLGVSEKVPDEYDTYLLASAAKLFHGVPHDRVVNYLVRTETKTMGLRGRVDARERAEKTVDEIDALFLTD